MSRRLLLSFVLLLLGAGLLGESPSWASSASEASSLSPPDTGQVPRTVRKYLVKGTVEAQLGDYKEAIVYFESALKRVPEDPTLLQALADAHAAKGDLSTALFYARRARRHSSNRAYYHRRLAELQRKAGQPHAAVRTYQALLRRFPDAQAAYRGLAELQASLDRPRNALNTYETLLRRAPSSPASVYRKMLPLYRRVGDAEGIKNTLKALVDYRPNVPRYRRLLGEHYANHGRPEVALDLLAPLAKQYPNDADLQRRVQRLSQKTGRPTAARPPSSPADSMARSAASVEQLVRRARAAFERATASSDSSALRTAESLLGRALDRKPRHVPALRLRARLHEQRGEHQQAGQLLKRAVEKNPRTPALWIRAARAYFNAHKYETAASVAEDGLLLFPGELLLARTAAFAQLRAGAPAQALNHFKNALAIQPSDSSGPAETATLRAGRALAYTYLDRPKDAAKALEEALAAAPDHPTVLRICAYALALRGEQLDRALDLARRAVEQSPADPRALDTLGWIHFQRGALKAARRTLRRALNTAPPTARILEHYGDVQNALGNDGAARRYWEKALDRAPDRSSLRKKLEEGSSS
ncbi:MAG: tetratricopeptide repeat protein [Salinibacter sp.]